MSYVNNKGTDQLAHPHSLISAFVVRCLDSVMSLVSVTKISSLILASVAAQAGLCLAWSETPEDTFCRVVTHSFVVVRTEQHLISCTMMMYEVLTITERIYGISVSWVRMHYCGKGVRDS